MASKRVGLFNQPIQTKSSKAKIKNPWDFSASDYDQRAGPSPATGDYYGSGFKNKVGKLRSDTVGYNPVSRASLGKPPKSMA